MKAALTLVALGLTLSHALAAGPVGVMTLDLENKANGRKVTSELWYEAAADAVAQPFALQPVFVPIAIARNAAPAAGGKRPLIIVSHGNWGSRFSQGWLMPALTSAGYVVLSTTHPGTAGNDQSAAGRFRLWDRSTDVSVALTEVLKDPKLAALIDETRIGFVGHSFGGWTGVSLAGGRYEPARQRAYCEQPARKDYYCSHPDDTAGIPAGDASASCKDARIKAFYLMASGPGKGFTKESLQSIRVPIVLDTAQFDDVLEPQANSSELAHAVPGAKEIVRPVGHFSYVPLCKLKPPASAGDISFICADPDGVDRARVHQEVGRDVVEFFNQALSRPARSAEAAQR
jgi:predicted dienelactone hydrolase